MGGSLADGDAGEDDFTGLAGPTEKADFRVARGACERESGENERNKTWRVFLWYICALWLRVSLLPI